MNLKQSLKVEPLRLNVPVDVFDLAHTVLQQPSQLQLSSFKASFKNQEIAH